VRSKNARAVDLSLYQAVNLFVEEIIIEKDATEDMNTTSSASWSDTKAARTSQLDGEKFEPFLHELALATLDPASDTDVESVRSARIQFASTLSKATVVNPKTREWVNRTCASWLESERSRPLRLLIEQVINENKSSLSG